MRTGVDSVDPAAFPLHTRYDAVVDLPQRLGGDQLAADRRLVGDDDHREVAGSKLPQCVKHPGEKLHVLPGPYVVVPIFVDDPVAIEKDSWIHR